MTPAELAAAPVLPAGLSAEAQSLWHTKQGNWEEAHNIAQDIHTAMGSWIHALLHVIEGDQWNADYWFSKAKKPSKGPKEVDALWEEIAGQVL
ncbi:hypothetical protein WJU23_02905 [Prosthecobacter sp. SYSU 5D2]|uniref:hypothetical protein n=1 Tax=Prosthecobacter sp. SYSU 5D2 TaxID=3134134 RepID=UPI0031FE8780